MFLRRCIQKESTHIGSSDVFFASYQDFGVFNMEEMDVTAGDEVAFYTTLVRRAGTEPDGEKAELQFRLTIGRRKMDGQLCMNIIPSLLRNPTGIRHEIVSSITL